MSDRPIIFSAPMVRALLAGAKTQTRRLLKPPVDWLGPYMQRCARPEDLFCSLKYAVGDRLWVREAHAFVGCCDPGLLVTRADYPACVPHDCENVPAISDIRWRPSIFMPRTASRLTLTVTDVRVQRLLDITEDDARAEGFEDGKVDDGFPARDIGGGWTIESDGGWATAAGMFQITWATLHPDWDGYSSPWVVAISFTVARGNIDA